MDAIGASLGGIQTNVAQLNASHQRIANGEIEAKPIVDSMIAQRGIEANMTALKTSLDTQETILDILA